MFRKGSSDGRESDEWNSPLLRLHRRRRRRRRLNGLSLGEGTCVVLRRQVPLSSQGWRTVRDGRTVKYRLVDTDEPTGTDSRLFVTGIQ